MEEMIQRNKNNLKVVDLFCGAGIGACGIKLAGYDIVWGIDNNKYAVDTYNKNIGNHAVYGDIRKLNMEDIPDHDLMIATPVCKSFSIAGNGSGVNDVNNGDLSYYFIKALEHKKPKAFLFENVQGMTFKKHKDFFDGLLNKLKDLNYNIKYKVVNCSAYGVPQDRKRVFIVGIRNDIDNKFNFPDEVKVKSNIKDYIYDLKFNKDIPNQEYLIDGYSSRYLSRNRQRQWNEQAFTIVSDARQLALYPEPANYDIRVENINFNPPPRRFSVRECLRLQTVPDWFTFDTTIPLKKQYERCSGIPSLMAYKLGVEIEKVIK